MPSTSMSNQPVVNGEYSNDQTAALLKLGEELLAVQHGKRSDTIANFALDLPSCFDPQRAPRGLEPNTQKGYLVKEFFSRRTERECTNVWCRKKSVGFRNIMVSLRVLTSWFSVSVHGTKVDFNQVLSRQAPRLKIQPSVLTLPKLGYFLSFIEIAVYHPEVKMHQLQHNRYCRLLCLDLDCMAVFLKLSNAKRHFEK